MSSHSPLCTLGITVFERGWLSSNCVLIQGAGPTALIDSGYATHAEQTVQLVRTSLGEQPLDLLLNTHLHSDHCGGNHLLQACFPNLQTQIPPGLSDAVTNWDPVALTFVPTGQVCERFEHQGLLVPGQSIQLGDQRWEIHGAKGHDPHSIVLFEPRSRVLISADAFWENGFGVVFPELEGLDAFTEVAATLDVIEELNPLVVIPGHGSVFSDFSAALSRARSRLDSFVKNPDRHRRYAVKVLLKFKLLEWQRVSRTDLLTWCVNTSYLRRLASIELLKPLDTENIHTWIQPFLDDLERSGALRVQDQWVENI